MSSYGRDKVLKEGPVRYKKYSISLHRWKLRHLVFKVTHAGRLQLIVYKESPPTAANEIKEISIDEFGGLEHNLRIDSEKYVFAIITTNMTECFSTESPQDLSDWKQLLQEYLGKELLISITIPPKQPMLKAGKGLLRIRNTGFTITTCENPPRCQGTWQIIHIRKYGGSDLFRFQTGSKCPTGEHLYSIETKDNSGLKKLFSDLSNHKPIFADDRLGRRMTLEKKFNQTAHSMTNSSSSKAGKNRLSLQTTDKGYEKHHYENREQFQTQRLLNISELTVPQDQNRRASFDDSAFGTYNPPTGQGTPSAGDELSRAYQNVNHGRSSIPESSTQPHMHFSTVNVPVPNGYYNVAPPTLVKRIGSRTGSPLSSPEDKASVMQELGSVTRSPTMDVASQQLASAFERYSPEISMDVVVDNLVASKSSQRSKAFSPAFDAQGDETLYQNVEFMRGSNGDGPNKRFVPDSLLMTDDGVPAVHTTIAEEPWSAHHYANVQLAQANMPGYGSRTTKTSTSRKVKMSETPSPSLDGKLAASAIPVKMIPVFQSLPISSSSDNLLGTSSDKSYKYGLRNSMSDFELATSASKEGGRQLDYYNYCAPNLPAHCSGQSNTMGLRNKFTLCTVQSPIFSDTPSDHDSTEFLSNENGMGINAAEYSKLVPLIAKRGGTGSQEGFRPASGSSAFKSIDAMKFRSSSCDCLASYSSTDSAESAQNISDTQQVLYDRLAPQTASGHSTDQGMYDNLEPYKDCAKSESSSPENSSSSISSDAVNKHFQYNRKSGYLRHEHQYDYIPVDKKLVSRSDSNSPENSNWIASLPFDNGRQKSKRSIEQDSRGASIKATISQSRKKQLPLQASAKLVSTDSERGRFNSDRDRSRPPKLTREDHVDGGEVMSHKTLPVTVKRNLASLQPRSSAQSLDLGSSMDSSHDHLSSGSYSSGENHRKQEPMVRIVTYKDMAAKSSSMIEEVSRATSSVSIHMPSDEPPPLPKKMPSKSASVRNSKELVCELPPLPRRANSESLAKVTNGSCDSPTSLHPRSHDPAMFTVPLPQAQFNFRPQPPPRPKVLSGAIADQCYTAVSFSDGTESSTTQRHMPVRSSGLSKNFQSSEFSYVAVDFEMTAGLQKTIDQVASHHREYFSGMEQTN